MNLERGRCERCGYKDWTEDGICGDCRTIYEPLVTGALRGQTVTLCAVTIGVPDGAPIRWRAWSRERPKDAMAEGDTPEDALTAFFATCAEGESTSSSGGAS